MMVTFPHLGPLSLALAQLFSYLDIPYLIPAKHGGDALKIGAAVSPEEMCIPFKIMAGNLISAYEDGADTAVMIATCGPCRLGEYGQLLMEILEKNSCCYKWVLLDSISEIGASEFMKRLSKLAEGRDVSYVRLAEGVSLCIKMIRKMDGLRSKITKRAGYLEEPYEAVRLLHEFKEQLKESGTFADCLNVIKTTENRLGRLAVRKNADPVKVLVVGEIYTSIEEESNMQLEEKLMKLGCSVERHIDISWWIDYSLKQAVMPQNLLDISYARNGIPCNIGGYGRETVSRMLKKRNHDGIIKIMPSGCMPEIAAKAFCENHDMGKACRILHLIFDEMCGNAGYETRIEAFIDMLERRKNVLAGDRYRLHKHRSGSDR